MRPTRSRANLRLLRIEAGKHPRPLPVFVALLMARAILRVERLSNRSQQYRWNSTMVEPVGTKSSDRNRAAKDDHLGPLVVLPAGAFPILESLCRPNSGDGEKAALIERLLRQGLIQGRRESGFDSRWPAPTVADSTILDARFL
jgi:hypothetical protein